MRLFAARSLFTMALSTSKGGSTAASTASQILPLSVHVPVGKDGDGAYTASTKGCFDVINAATPLVLEEVAKQHIRPGAFHIADYGTADAGTSLGLLSLVVKTLREREMCSDKEVVVHYEDQHTNEWKSVFNHALGYRTVDDAYGNVIETPYKLGNVFVEACGVGFHSQCYPSESVDLGVSFTAMHWLSNSPNSLWGSNMMHAARCPDGPPPAERLQAATDWENILRARSKELVKGGRFVCINFCISKEGYFLGQTDVGSSMWDSFQEAWDLLKEQNIIDEEERLGVSFPNYYRTTKEFVEGVEKCPDLRLISAEEKVVRCPYREQFKIGNKSTDTTSVSAEEYAKSFVPTTRTWSHSTFEAALNDSHSSADKKKILEQFWKNYEDIVAKSPEEHGMDYVHSYLVIEKV